MFRASGRGPALSLVTALMAALLVGCGGGGEMGSATPGACGGDVLLLTVDTLRSDHLSLYGYDRPTSPQLERWLAGAALYRRAYSTETCTPPSVVSLLSGLLPQEHRVRLFHQLVPEEIPLLPDLLPPCYQSAAFVSNPVLTGEALGIARRFDHYDDFVDHRELDGVTFFERDAGPTTDAALAWLAGLRDRQRSLFLWVHYMDPHGPYRPPPAWARSFHHDEPLPVVREKIPAYQLQPGITDAREYVDLYDEEIAYLDAEIGRLLAGYAALFDLDEALVLFTADHGEVLMERQEWFRHGHQVYEELARVPLAVRAPGVVPGVRDEITSGVDVAPTVLRFAGAEPPRRLPGVDLVSGEGLGPERIAFVEALDGGSQWRAALQGEGKWVAAVSARRDLFARRFYDLASDPGERRRRPWPPGAAARRLEALVGADPDPGGLPDTPELGAPLSRPKVSPRADPEALKALRALGYVGDG